MQLPYVRAACVKGQVMSLKATDCTIRNLRRNSTYGFLLAATPTPPTSTTFLRTSTADTAVLGQNSFTQLLQPPEHAEALCKVQGAVNDGGKAIAFRKL